MLKVNMYWVKEAHPCVCNARNTIALSESHAKGWPRYQIVCQKCGRHTGWYKSISAAKRYWSEGHIHPHQKKS